MADFRACTCWSPSWSTTWVEAADDKQFTTTIARVAGNGTLAAASQKPLSRHMPVCATSQARTPPASSPAALSEPRCGHCQLL
jgi:hypothetical protein